MIELLCEDIKGEVERLRKEITRLQFELVYLRQGCKAQGHQIVPRDEDIEEKLKVDIWESTGAYCECCLEYFGWWCPKSPDHLCHYSKALYDECDYCGMPNERK